jgi:hypothetical protein
LPRSAHIDQHQARVRGVVTLTRRKECFQSFAADVPSFWMFEQGGVRLPHEGVAPASSCLRSSAKVPCAEEGARWTHGDRRQEQSEHGDDESA